MPTLIDRLRAGADNIHSIGPARAADLMREAADALAVPSERATTHEARRLELVRTPRTPHQDAVAALGLEPLMYVEPPGKLLHKHIWSESGDGCWDCLLALGRAGTPVYRLPYLDTDVALAFPRELLEGLVLEIREVDGRQTGYLRLILPEDLSTPIGAPSLAVAEQFDAEARSAAEDPGELGDIGGVEIELPPMPVQLAEHQRRMFADIVISELDGVDPEPRGESYTPEQEAEAAEQAERFQGLDDSDRE
jgi:hypothetical protein